MELEYKVDGDVKSIHVSDTQEFTFGKDEVLSNSETDVTYKFNWYESGYTVESFLKEEDFFSMKKGIEESVKKIIENLTGKEIKEFTLEEYHKFVTNDEDHFKIVSKTRDLFTDDFNFNIDYLIPKLENILGIGITDYDELHNYKAHIIVRINRPFSSDFNPPHKDIYEHFDGEGYVPRFINFWIPICGVTKNSVLPISPKSHLISEKDISRTTNGSEVNGHKYRVRLIKSWNKDNSFIKPDIKYGDVLIFSPHLIHGLSLNEQSDTTRVALEFRLYEKTKQ